MLLKWRCEQKVRRFFSHEYLAVISHQMVSGYLRMEVSFPCWWSDPTDPTVNNIELSWAERPWPPRADLSRDKAWCCSKPFFKTWNLNLALSLKAASQVSGDCICPSISLTAADLSVDIAVAFCDICDWTSYCKVKPILVQVCFWARDAKHPQDDTTPMDTIQHDIIISWDLAVQAWYATSEPKLVWSIVWWPNFKIHWVSVAKRSWWMQARHRCCKNFHCIVNVGTNILKILEIWSMNRIKHANIFFVTCRWLMT